MISQFSTDIISKNMVRKSYKQKSLFIDKISTMLDGKQFDYSIKKQGISRSRNIVVGDINRANTIITAHYDTCANIFIPNICFPFSIFKTTIYQILIAVVFIIFSNIIYSLLGFVVDFNIILIFMCFMMICGISNKNNYNDNTSGVVCLIELINQLDQLNDVAFVFFDNEEKGLLGSGLFKRKSEVSFNSKVVINLDCVSDGDHILILPSKKISDKYFESFLTHFENDDKLIVSGKDTFFFYPSDQNKFPINIGICACNKNKILGYYIDKIHTSKDVVFDEKNIQLITDSLLKIILKTTS